MWPCLSILGERAFSLHECHVYDNGNAYKIELLWDYDKFATFNEANLSPYHEDQDSMASLLQPVENDGRSI